MTGFMTLKLLNGMHEISAKYQYIFINLFLLHALGKHIYLIGDASSIIQRDVPHGLLCIFINRRGEAFHLT